jgi:hypothetical protein
LQVLILLIFLIAKFSLLFWLPFQFPMKHLLNGILALLLLLPALSASEHSSAFILPADGFDYPVGKPNGTGYYLARGFRSNGHLGEDWNGRGGGNTDLGDPVYATANGVVVLSRDQREGWGNVIIIRHAFRDSSGRIEYVDSLYGHLNERSVAMNETVTRGQQIGTIGTNRGMYWAHLHFEIRKNLQIGMNRAEFARNFSNYYDPSAFVARRRQLPSEMRPVRVPTGTFNETSTDQFADFMARMSTTPPQAPVVRTPPKPEETAAQSTEDQGERDKIRSFWDKIRAGTVTTGTDPAA